MTNPTPSRFGLFNTEAHILHSSCADQDYQIGVWFPFSYASSERTYPVLYVPDGEFVFPAVAGLLPTLMGAGEVLEMLVVGIAYHGVSSWGEFGALRDRDFCTQPFQSPGQQTRHEQYARFIQQELFPFIENHYRADPQERAVFGFSSGGFFSLNMLFTRPGMFRRHIAASCTWPGAGEYLLSCAQHYAAQPGLPASDLFLAVGEQDEEQIRGFHQLTGFLSTAALPNLHLQTRVFPNEGHSAGVIAKAILEGLKSVFSQALIS